MDEVLYSRSIRLLEHAHCICHQEQTHTFALCSTSYDHKAKSKTNFIRLLDDLTFGIIFSYTLNELEDNCSILSCSFGDDDDKVYYCVGTAYDKENSPKKGRVLVFIVEDKELKLIAEQETGAVSFLNAYNGGLLAIVRMSWTTMNAVMYKCMQQDGGSWELKSEGLLKLGSTSQVLCVNCCGDFFVTAGKGSKSIRAFKFLRDAGFKEVAACDYFPTNPSSRFAVEINNNSIFLCAEEECIWTLQKVEAKRCLDRIGTYYFGDTITCFRRCSTKMPLLDSDVTQIPVIIFGTISGRVGVIGVLPFELYYLLQKVEGNLQRVIEGVGGLSHGEWRRSLSGCLDGNLIQSFFNLTASQREEITKKSSDAVIPVFGNSRIDLEKVLLALKRLHFMLEPGSAVKLKN